MTEIEEGEKGFIYDEAAEDELRKRMGLPRRRETQEGDNARETDESRKRQRSVPQQSGIGTPRHDPVQGGAETDGQSLRTRCMSSGKSTLPSIAAPSVLYASVPIAYWTPRGA